MTHQNETSPPTRPKIGSWKANSTALYVQAKYDGIMVTVYRGSEGINVYSRHKDPAKGLMTHKIDESDWFHKCSMNLRYGESIFGELYRPGQPASAVKSDYYACKFIAFALPHLNPSLRLEGLDVRCVDLGLDFAEWYSWADESDWLACPWRSHLLDPRHCDSNFEGFVFKDGNLTGWKKLKPELTIDLIVRRCNLSLSGKFLGQFGALSVMTTEGDVVADVGLLEDAIRLAINPETDVGRVIEVKYQYVAAKGRLRHPRFIRWRDDKDPSECGRNQDPDLEKHWN